MLLFHTASDVIDKAAAAAAAAASVAIRRSLQRRTAGQSHQVDGTRQCTTLGNKFTGRSQQTAPTK